MKITGKKIVRSTFAYAAAKGALQLLVFLKILLLARILTPADFGLMGIVTIVVSTLESVTITGVDLNLVRKQQNVAEYINTAWTISILRGMVLFLLTYGTADLIAVFFHSPESVALLKAIGSVFIIRGFANSNIIYFTKQLDIRKQLALNLSELLTDVCFSIVLSLIFRNVWGMVWGFLAAAVARTCTSFLLTSDRPRLCFDPSRLRELSRFGKYVWGTNITVLVSNKIDSVIIGRLLDAASLGLYQMALKLTEPITKEIGNLMAQIMFPAYSSMQDDRERLTRAYLKTVKLVFSLFLPVTIFTICYADRLIPLLLGRQWSATVPVIQLLIAACLFRSLFGVDAWTYYALGKPGNNFVIALVRLVTLFVCMIALTTRYGIQGSALAVCIANAILIVPVIRYSGKIMGVNLTMYLKNILIPFAVPLLTILPAYRAGGLLPDGYWWAGAATGIAAFFTLFNLMERELCRELAGKLRA